MATAMTLREDVQEEKILIEIETNSAEHSIRRSGRKELWLEASVEEAIKKSLSSHERWKTIDPSAYDLENNTVNDVHEAMQGRYYVVVNDFYVIAQDTLNSVKIGDLVKQADDTAYKYGVRIRVQRDEPAKKVSSKYDVLREELKEMVDALSITGLFAGNLLQQTTIDPRAIEFLSGKAINGLVTKAHNLFRNKDYKGALEIYDVFLKVEPENADYHFLSGKALICLGEYEKGLQSLEDAKRLGHDKAGVVVQTILDFRKQYGMYPLREQAELF